MGLGGGLGVAEERASVREERSLGGGGLGAGTGLEIPDGTGSAADWGFGATKGFSVDLEGWGTEAGAGFGAEGGDASAAV